MIRRALEDLDAVIARDPATSSRLEALLVSPGVHAIWAHRLAHRLWTHGMRLPARLVMHWVRVLTGIEIHPGATLGRRLVIDHGHGVVIGETAVVGDDVLMFHGVTLGGRVSHPGKRHPTVGDRVLLGAHAVVLGDISVGDDAKIAAGAVLTSDLPDRATHLGRGPVDYPDESARAVARRGGLA